MKNSPSHSLNSTFDFGIDFDLDDFEVLTLVLNVNNNINNNNNNNNNLNINAVDSSNVVANFNTNNANQVKDSFSLSSFSSFPPQAPPQLLKKEHK